MFDILGTKGAFGRGEVEPALHDSVEAVLSKIDGFGCEATSCYFIGEVI